MLMSRAACAAALAAGWFWTFAGHLEAAEWNWNVVGGGAWSEPGNWSPSGPPNGIDAVANISQNTPSGENWIITGASGTLGSLLLRDTEYESGNIRGWNIRGSTLTIDVSSGSGLISSRESIHLLETPVVLNDNVDIVYTRVGPSQRFNLTNSVSSGAGLTTNIDINRINPYGSGGFGRVCFDGNNTFTGDVRVWNSMFQLGSSGALPSTASVTIESTASMRLLYNYTNTIDALNGSGNITMYGLTGNKATLVVGSADGSDSYSGSIYEEGTTYDLALRKTGSGTQTLSGASTYRGGTTISQGTLVVANGSALGTGPIVLGDAATGPNAVALRSNVNFARDITVSSSGTGTVTIAGDVNDITYSGTLSLNRSTILGGIAGDRYAYSGKITGNVGTLTIDAPRITLEQGAANASDFTGSVVINPGRILQFNSIHGLSGQHAVTADGSLYLNVGDGGKVSIGSLSGTGHAGLHPDVSGTQTLSVGGDNANGSFSGTLSNGGGVLAIVKSGTGTQTLSGASTYTGTTTVSTGTLLVGDPAALGTGASAIQLGDANTGANNVALLTNAWGESGYLYFDRSITVNNSGSGTITIGSNAAGAGGRPVEFRGDITLNKDLHLRGANVDRTSFTKSITGTGNLYIDGPHRITFSGDNNFVGDVFVGAGMAQLQNGNTIPNASNVTIAPGATLRIWDASETINGLNGSGFVQIGHSARTLTVGAAGADGSFSGVLRSEGAGVLSLVKAGAGTQILSGDNIYTGSTTILDGILQVDGSIASTADVTVTAGLLRGKGSIAGKVVAGPDGSVSAGHSPGHILFGAYDQIGGTMIVDIWGHDQGTTYDWIDVIGAAALYGTVEVRLGGGVELAIGDSFEVLTASSAVVDGPLNLTWDISSLSPIQYWDYRIVPFGAGQALELFVVPEPASFPMLLIAGGMVLWAAAARRRLRKGRGR